MSKWYKATRYSGGDIEAVGIVKETEHCVYLQTPYRKNPDRHNKVGDWQSFFPTFEEARQWLIALATKRIESATAELQRAEKALKKAQSLTEGLPDAEKEQEHD